MITITKRDGQIVEFEPTKITLALQKAFQSTIITDDTPADVLESIGETIANITKSIIKKSESQSLTVEMVQDMIEDQLMKTKYKDVAKSYIRYRHQRNLKRKAKETSVFMDVVSAKNTDITRENANMNADTPAGMMMKFASETTKPFVSDYLLSEPVLEYVRANYLHIHDQDYYPTKSLTCLQHPLDRILDKGFMAGHGESRAAKRIETASILACISLEGVQNEMHGGQAIPAFDFYMAPYVRKSFIEELKFMEKLIGCSYESLYNTPIDDYIEREIDDNAPTTEKVIQHAINRTVQRVHQSMEAFIHNMNTIHSRGGNQVVFSSINYGTDTSAEGRCVTRELLNTTYRGVGNNATAIFPIQIWKKKRGVSYFPQDKNYDLYKLACKVSARRFFPNFLNLDSTFNQHEKWRAEDPKRFEYEVATMGCRTRVFENNYGEKTSVGRGNISFSTINIVAIAIECMGIEHKLERIDAFYEKLTSVLDVAGQQLHERFEFQATAIAKQFPILMSGLWNGSQELKPTDSVRSVINQGTLAIGYIGLAECLVALTGKHHGESIASQQLGLDIVQLFNDKCKAFSKQYNHNYGVIATPAEGLSGKFTKVDKVKYGIIPGVTDRDYYTNSNHVPVYYQCTADHKAKIEGPYHELTKAGHIFYVEMDGDATHNEEAIMEMVDKMDKYNIGYLSVNHNRNRCLKCNYEDAEESLSVCPNCGSEDISTLQRITGYLVGATDRWNSGKLAELKDRVVHD
ncbi:MAG: anaerobic ribonucleoside triphosphate reductase [Bacteroidales bacterium]